MRLGTIGAIIIGVIAFIVIAAIVVFLVTLFAPVLIGLIILAIIIGVGYWIFGKITEYRVKRNEHRREYHRRRQKLKDPSMS